MDLLFSNFKDNQNISIKILKKDYKNRYIKIGVNITDVGIADILINGSPLDEIKQLINMHQNICGSIPSLQFKIDVVLI